MEKLSRDVAIALMDKGYTMATIEECTCGLIGAAIASQEYAQRWYKGTLVPYTEEMAMKLLDIPPYTIERNDFVSCQVAQQMALCGLYKFDVNICVSIVGYIDGYGSNNIGAGEVQICVAKLDENKAIDFKYKKLHVKAMDKGDNMEECIKEALKLTLEHIIGEQ